MLSYCSLSSCRLSLSPSGRIQITRVGRETVVASDECLVGGQALTVVGRRQVLFQDPVRRGGLPVACIDAAPTPVRATAPGGAHR